MAKMCIKIDHLDESKYSAPVPVIGLYIIGATLVCFAFMLYDILSGFVHRKRWIPCRLFSLNSVTLTLISVTAKLPVDLTTPMPSALDQFSKLTGTTIVCTCMAFLLPSLGSNKKSECLTNMAALSIFVVTIVVNICIQIRTGLIILFIPEHIVIMCCMLLLLLLLWISALDINYYKVSILNVRSGLIEGFQGSMLGRLQLGYMFGYSNNPQFMLCTYVFSDLVTLLSTLCLVVIIQAASRSLQLKFCRGVSVYDWSIWIIVVTQVLTITLACFVTCIRMFTCFKSGEKLLGGESDDFDTRLDIWLNPVLRNSISERYKAAVQLILAIIMVMVFYLPWMVKAQIKEGLMVCFKFNKITEDSNEIREYKAACRKVQDHIDVFDEWSLEKSVKDMKKWMDVSKSRRSLNHLLQLLLKTHHSSRPLDAMEIKDELHPDQQGIKVSSLSIVVLARIAQVSMPIKLSASLVEAYSESHEIIHFIFDRINSVTSKNKKITQIALAVWIGDNFIRLLPADFFESLPNSVTDDLVCAQEIIKKLQYKFGQLRQNYWSSNDLVCDEAGIIMKFISCRQYSSIEDMYNYIEQLFVDMLHIVLAKLPLAIFKYVTESPAEEFEERVKLALKILCQVEPLETHVQWSFPAECNISSLIAATPVPDVIDQNL